MNLELLIHFAGAAFTVIAFCMFASVIVIVLRGNSVHRAPKEAELEVFNITINAQLIEEFAVWLRYNLVVYHETGSHIARDDAAERIRRLRELLSICEQQMASLERERGL